jgi:hypothetical protein
VGAGHGPLRK